MSLVAYDDSSDDDNSSEDEPIQIERKSPPATLLNGYISDEDEYENSPLSNNTLQDHLNQPQKHFALPPPKNVNEELEADLEEEKELPVLAFDKLPKPKTIDEDDQIAEEDDEFLHKKEAPPEEEKPPPPRIPQRKGPVKITIPSLSEFKDLEVSKRSVEKPTSNSSVTKLCGLLSLLPKPKSETVFEKDKTKSSVIPEKPPFKAVTSLVPDSVKNNAAKKPAAKLKHPPKRKALVQHGSDSEGSDGESTDFFSFNSEQKLPEVSEHEINAMVSKKAAEMAKSAQKVKEILEERPQESEPIDMDSYKNIPGSSSSKEIGFDERAIKALVGSRAKRQKIEEVNIVELSANEVLPDKEEWLRTALASSTSYQPKGVLVDEEPAPGTRRKHQITYLAHQAKANELELQAMWSANRHTRRQTQGKYGF